MVKFDEKKELESVKGALALRPQVEEIVDKVMNDGCRNICWLGIGGTWASCMFAQVHMKEKSALEIFTLNASEYLTTGDKRVGEGTFVIISSVTGTTEEMVKGVNKIQEAGAKVLGFIDKEGSDLVSKVDYCISYPLNEQLKFLMVADRIMYNAGEFDDYGTFYKQLEGSLAEGLVEISKKADKFGEEFAKAHMNDKLHYFVGAGTLYGPTYSYGMCFWEEMHWIRTKSIHSAEFFHGMFEIVDKDTPVTVFVGEDSQRDLGLRVGRFLEKISENYTVIDTKDYDIPGIDERFRGNLSYFILHAVTNRIDIHIENISGHDMEIRRYYRKVEY